MDKRAFDTLKKTVEGHTQGPWKHNGWSPPRLWPRHLIDADGAEVNPSGYALAAAAPDLLEDNKRLRGWMECIQEQSNLHVPSCFFADMAKLALDGAEVPE